MARTTGIVASRQRKKKTLKLAKGYFGGRSKLYRSAKETVNRSLAFATRDRKTKKRTIRNLWIVRINAAVRSQDLTYNRFMDGLKKANIEIDRKVLAVLALDHKNAFNELVSIAKQQLKEKPKAKPTAKAKPKAKKTKKAE